VTKEHHIYGPPGAGKTTYAVRQIQAAAEKYGKENVLVSSFTKAAATELIGRDLPIPKHMVGTLHSLCYRAMERPALAEGNLKHFNDSGAGDVLSESKAPDVDDLGTGDGEAQGNSSDQLLGQYQLLRARRTPREAWPASVEAFARRWEEWKNAGGLLDYTDLIEYAPQVAPGSPRVMFVDEAQDLNALQFQVIRQWAQSMEQVVMLGDDDQTIYSWSGADPENLLQADANRIVLKRSHRLPQAVLGYARAWVETVTRRQPKEFGPRPLDKDKPDGPVAIGSVRTSPATIRHPEMELDAIREHAAAGRSVMLLASCGYMLRAWIEHFRLAGIAYHNPYRVSRGDWNPLKQGEGSAAQRVSSFLAKDDRGHWPYWTMWNLNQWCEVIKAEGVLRRGAKTEIAQLAEDQPAYRPSLEEMQQRWFEHGMPWTAEGDFPEDGEWPPANAADWLVQRAMPQRAKALAYAASIAQQAVTAGEDPRKKLVEPPKVIVGTIHSVKGAQADVVYLAPDLSPQAAEQWYRGERARDEIKRLMYVGMSRAFEELVVLRAAGAMAAQLPEV
jgi:DNA helicase II / ATP-dependent DNA helicase PcrA